MVSGRTSRASHGLSLSRAAQKGGVVRSYLGGGHGKGACLRHSQPPVSTVGVTHVGDVAREVASLKCIAKSFKKHLYVISK